MLRKRCHSISLDSSKRGSFQKYRIGHSTAHATAAIAGISAFQAAASDAYTAQVVFLFSPFLMPVQISLQSLGMLLCASVKTRMIPDAFCEYYRCACARMAPVKQLGSAFPL